jgi:hypothetical protein
MKNLLVVLLFGGLNAQAQCPDHPFQTVNIYYQYNQGAGFEAGLWPTETSRFGGFIGLGLIRQQISTPGKSANNSDPVFNTYLKGQFRFNRYLNLTASAGLLDLEKAYYLAGLRMTIPFNEHALSAIIIEPQYGSLGFIAQAGVGIKIGD